MIKIGDMLIIEPKYAQQEEKYKAMVVETDEGCLYIDYPVNIKTGKVSFLMDGTELKIICTGNDVVMFDSEVLGRMKLNIPMIQLSCPPAEDFLKIQRRQFVRIDTGIDVAVHPVNNEFPPFTAVTSDLSAGGASINLKSGHPPHFPSYIIIWLVLPLKSGEIQYLKVKCKTIRKSETPDGRSKLSVQFIEQTESDTQNLMRYIFEKQLDLKKKGIIGV